MSSYSHGADPISPLPLSEVLASSSRSYLCPLPPGTLPPALKHYTAAFSATLDDCRRPSFRDSAAPLYSFPTYPCLGGFLPNFSCCNAQGPRCPMFRAPAQPSWVLVWSLGYSRHRCGACCSLNPQGCRPDSRKPVVPKEALL